MLGTATEPRAAARHPASHVLVETETPRMRRKSSVPRRRNSPSRPRRDTPLSRTPDRTMESGVPRCSSPASKVVSCAMHQYRTHAGVSCGSARTVDATPAWHHSGQTPPSRSLAQAVSAPPALDVGCNRPRWGSWVIPRHKHLQFSPVRAYREAGCLIVWRCPNPLSLGPIAPHPRRSPRFTACGAIAPDALGRLGVVTVADLDPAPADAGMRRQEGRGDDRAACDRGHRLGSGRDHGDADRGAWKAAAV